MALPTCMFTLYALSDSQCVGIPQHGRAQGTTPVGGYTKNVHTLLIGGAGCLLREVCSFLLQFCPLSELLYCYVPIHMAGFRGRS